MITICFDTFNYTFQAVFKKVLACNVLETDLFKIGSKSVTLSNTIFGLQYPLSDSCRVFRPEHNSASRIVLSPSVFERIDFEKKTANFQL